MRWIYCLSLTLFLNLIAPAQNPIVPPGIYIADPSAHVWKDGKLYVYGSRDESLNYYCSRRYDVLSTGDLKVWNITTKSFVTASKGNQGPFPDSLLLAPDVQYKNGKFYLYYCMFDFVNAEGVAVADSPTGPFTSRRSIYTKGISQIDPCVFTDDDGQAYFIWGQFNAKVAKLKTNMTEIDTTTIKENVVTQKEHYFHEGGYMIKRNGLYYFIYSDMSRSGRPTCIGYSTSKSPFGPFTYRGIIIDNSHSDPAVWNNHGSVVKFNNQWYVFYHRSTNGSTTMRKACLEPIAFLPNGSIPEVEMTSQGAAGPLNPFLETDAARACLLFGNVRIKTVAENNEALGEIRSNDKAAYKYFDFKQGADSISIRIMPGNKISKIDLIIDELWGQSIGSIEVPAKIAEGWMIIKAAVRAPKGVHALWFRFSDPATTNFLGFSVGEPVNSCEELMSLDSFQFFSHNN